MKRHVGLVIGQLGTGGAEKQLSLLARGLKEAGENVSVLCLSEELAPFGQVILKAGVPLYSMPRRGRNETGRVWKLARLLRKLKVSLVHSFLEEANIYTYLARPLAGGPVFLPTVRSLSWPMRRLKAALHGRALREASVVLANCRASAESFAGLHRLPLDRFRVVHNGVELPREPAANSRRAARGRFKLPEKNLVIGTAGKAAPDKNVPAFLRLGAELGAKLGNVCAIAAGRGLDEHYAVSHDLKRTSVRQAFFLGDIREMELFYAALDVFVLTSLREGLPNVVLEAMAAGLPVAAYAVGGVVELVEHGISGLLVPPGDEQALFETVRSILLDPELAHELGSAARQRAAEHFSVSGMVERTRGLYNELEGN